MRAVSFTSDVSCLIGELLNFILCQDTKHNDTVKALFETFMRSFEGFGIDETSINLCPTSSRRNALLRSLCNFVVSGFCT